MIGRSLRAVKGLRPAEKPSFVGRAPELRQITALLGGAEDGEGQVVVIQGPPGIGKTRLAEEVVARARRRGAHAAIGRCWQDGEAPPLWPWLTILRELGAPDSLLEERHGEAPQGRFARFVAVLDYLRAASREATLVIVVDDAHLADSATLLLARFLAREGRSLPLLLLLTRRDDRQGLAPETLELLGELDRQATAIALSALSEDAMSAYLSASGLAPDPELLHVVAAVTKGNPLHLRSLTIQSELGSGGLREGLEHAAGSVLERLSEGDRRLIALAALLGPEAFVHEVARVAEESPARAADSLARAASLGLATDQGAGRFAFVHDLVRRSAIGSLAMAERLDAHARAATLLTGDEPERRLRRAHHALLAASRSSEDAAIAVRLAREAARAVQAVDGFETAAALFARAAEIHDSAGLTSPAAELAVEWAECVLGCGRLAEARPLFQRAARMAETENDSMNLARAALGLSGVWLGEHRLSDEAERVLALQDRALGGLPADALVLRTRLTVRLAAERAYRNVSVTPLLEGVEAARQTGDAHALAEALSLCHNALLTPEHTWRRPALAGEVIATAAAAGDGLLQLLGLCWRTADLFLLGHPGAGAALEELRLRADALRCRSILFIVRAMEVMLAIRAGHFDRAEAAAAACFELGNEVGDADALAYHGAHLTAIRFFQGREAEMVELAASIATSPTLITERDRAFATAAALFALRAGRPEPARAVLAQLGRDGLGSLPTTSSWLSTMLIVVEMASVLGDAPIAQAAYDALAPYAELPLMASLAVVCFGSVHRALGLAAFTCGKLDLATHHLESAVTANERLGHRPAAIQAQAELALALLQRAGDGDVERARPLLEQARSAAEAAGMSALAARWPTLAPAAETRVAPAGGHAARMTFVPPGRWRLTLQDQVATVPDRIGMRYVARLIAAPDQAVPALALVIDGATPPAPGRADAVMDAKALRALRERIRELRQRGAASPSDQDEIETLTQELARATGLGGRIRSFTDAPERARTAVQKAIKRAIEEITAANPAVGRHLALRIETGATCCYRLESVPSTGV